MPDRLEQPLSYIKWLQGQDSELSSESDLFDLYNTYVKKFYIDHSEKGVNAKTYITSQYVALLKDITLNYTTLEERRFLSNIDFNDRTELDTVLPFYVKKIREITQYISKKRQNIQFQQLKNSFKGSLEGVEQNVRNIVLDLISDDDFIGQYENSFIPPLSSIVDTLTIDIHPLYDKYQNYFDVDPEIEKSTYVAPENDELEKLFGANVQERQPFTWLSLLEAVNVLFGDIPQLIQTDGLVNLTTANNELITGTLVKSIDDIPELPLKFFLDAEKTSDNLITNVQRQLNEKFTGTDFYFLSTGSTTTQYISGLLYEAQNPVANYLNRYWSSHAVIPNKLNLETEKNIGLFFTPNKQGILNYHTLDMYYDLDVGNLLPNSIYLFPDPQQYGAGRGQSKVDQSSVYKHYDDVSKLKATRLNHSQEGEIINDSSLQKFYPYQSREESLGMDPQGISRSTDDFDFWTGETNDIWAHEEVYKIDPINRPPFESKINDLLITDSVVYEWKTDIFGNDYALIKNTKPQRKTSEQKAGTLTNAATQDGFDDVNSSLYNTTTGAFEYPTPPYYNYQLSNYVTQFTTTNDDITAAKAPYERLDTSGTLYFRNLYSTDISPASSALSAVFVKYTVNPDIADEINNKVKNFDVIRDTIILETESFVIIEKFAYDYESTTFTSTLPFKAIVSLSGSNRSLEKFGNIFYDEHTTDIFLTSTVLHPFLSSSNYKIIYPNIHKFNIKEETFKPVFTLSSLLKTVSSKNLNEYENTYTYLSGQGFAISDVYSTLSRISAEYINIESIDRPLISINEDDQTFGVNYFGHDGNCTLYMYNQYFNIADPDNITVKKLDFFRPIHDVFNYNIGGYKTNSKTNSTSISGFVEGPLDRGDVRESKTIAYESFKSQIKILGRDEFTMTFDSSLSGRKSTPDKTFDFDNNTIRMGVGLSATADDTLVGESSAATHSHNTSYILFTPSLSGINDDISVCFDFALYTLTTGNSGYAQVNLDKNPI